MLKQRMIRSRDDRLLRWAHGQSIFPWVRCGWFAGVGITTRLPDAAAQEQVRARLAAAGIHPVAQIDYWFAIGS
jgi:hypothetical protein